MTATEPVKVSAEFAVKHHLEGVGYGYAQGRIDAGDHRLGWIDASDFGEFFAAQHSRALDLPDLYEQFAAQLSTKDDS